jgi:hypothetical protein
MGAVQKSQTTSKLKVKFFRPHRVVWGYFEGGGNKP